MSPSRSQFVALALQAFRRHESLHSLAHYTGVLSLQGLAHLAVEQEDLAVLDLLRDRLQPFLNGERVFPCNFPNYHCGGNATAYLFWKGQLPEAAHAVQHHARLLVETAPRDRAGIFSNPASSGNREQIWIDVAFAVTPFLLFAGLALGDDRYVEEAFQQTRKMVAVFRDPANGLLHQCRGFFAPGRLTEDHWSRGNGWALLALTELIDGLPAHDPRRPEAERLFLDLMSACLAHQDPDGLWHQEMTLPSSYTETSGTGLILHGLGVGLATDLLPANFSEAFERGLRNYLTYADDDMNVRHTCRGCRSPGDGSMAAYLATPHVTNDPHAFGPLILALSAAARRERLCVSSC